jgi:hypothetical protein
MLDRSAFWSAPPAAGVLLATPAITVRLLPAIPQAMVSGDPGRALARFGLTSAAGLLDETAGDRYALHLARNRILVVGVDLPDDAEGWSDGLAVSSMTGALAVLDVMGPKRMDLVARATAIDPAWRSPSAALHFAGVLSALHSHGEALRLHFDRGLVTYMADWIAANDLTG